MGCARAPCTTGRAVLQALLALLQLTAARGCVCPPEKMDGIWGGIALHFSDPSWDSKNQNGTIAADTAGSQYSALGSGVGEWSGGYHYFRVSMNFSGAPGVTYSGQLDCTCDQLGIGIGHNKAPPGVPTGLNIFLNTTRGPLNWTGPALPAPAWVRNLSIYELNPRGFTSPAGVGKNGTCWTNAVGSTTKGGCGSGTWKALTEQGIPYLEKLGVTGIWVAGSGLADSHFFGIWSTYASIDPSKLDPVLGSDDDFKTMVAAAHTAGIKVFLDVTTHGLVDSSPLISQHPDWFIGGKWQMTDFNYESDEFVSWWVETWISFVKNFGVDGFRLDGPNGVAYQSDTLKTWDAIAAGAKAVGHEIAVFGEVHRYHFSEHDASAPKPSAVGNENASKQDLAGSFKPVAATAEAIAECAAEFNGAPGKSGQYETMMFSCHDSGWTGPPGNKLNILGSRASLAYHGVFSWRIPLFFSGEEFNNEPTGLPALAAGIYSGAGPCCRPGQKATGGWSYGTQIPPLDSIAANATRSGMLADVSRMFAIQKTHSGAIHRDRCTARVASLANASVVNTATGENVTAGNLWVPYARWVAGVGGEAPTSAAVSSLAQGAANQERLQEQELIVVAANPDPRNSITIKPHLSEEFLTAVFGASVSKLKVTNLWAAEREDFASSRSLTSSIPSGDVVSLAQAANEITMELGKDKSVGGGVGVIMLTAS